MSEVLTPDNCIWVE